MKDLYFSLYCVELKDISHVVEFVNQRFCSFQTSLRHNTGTFFLKVFGLFLA